MVSKQKSDTIRKLKYQNNSFEKYCTEIFQPSCNAEPILTPELQKRAMSEIGSDSGSVANSIQSRNIGSRIFVSDVYFR